MIFIVGGTGRIGQELLKQLAAKKVKAKVLVRSAEKVESVKKLGHEPVQGDVSNPSSFAAALSGMDSLFLLTGAGPSPEAWGASEIAVIDAAQKAGVKKVVQLSVIGASLESPLQISQQHAKVEEHLKKSGLAYTILQPSGFMQNLLGQVASIKQGAYYGNYKEGKMGYIDVRDIAAVAVATLTEPGHDGQSYVLTGGEALNGSEIASKIGKTIGKSVNYVDVPTEAAVQNMTRMGFPEWLAKDLGKMGEFVAAGYTGQTTDVVEKLLKRKPTAMDQFIADHAVAFKG